MNTRIAFLSVLLCAAATALHAMPPTVDPTYGLPPPSHRTTQRVPEQQPVWIWAGHTADNQTIFLRTTRTLDRVPKSAPLFITADNFFTLFVNGQQVDQSVPDPKDDNVWQHVHRVDIAQYLTIGKNVIAVRVVNAGGAAGLIARLDLGGKPVLLTGPAWKASEAVPPDTWTSASFDDSAWLGATVIAPLGGGPWQDALQGWPDRSAGVPYLAHLPVRPASVELIAGQGQIDGAASVVLGPTVHLTVQPAASGASHPPSLLLDFGREMAGRIEVQGPDGAQVQVATGESREECLKSPWHGPVILTPSADAPAYSPYSAFRYARVSFFGAQPYTLTNLILDDKYYPVQYKGRFDCSDPLLTKIWYTGAYTSHLCMQEDIWDAPKRDRARWIGDLNVSGEVINDAFADKFLMEQTMQRLRDDAQGGRPADQPPNDHVNGIPGYSCAWICTLADFQRHLGDDAYLKKQHGLLLSLVEYLRGETDSRSVFVNTRGKWPFVDWSPGFDGQSPQALAATHLFLIRAVRDSVFLLNEMGDKTNAAKYAAWADTLTDAAHQYLADPATQTYGDRLQENAMAVYSGAATPAQTAAIAQTVLNPDSAAWDKTGDPPYNNGVVSPYYGNYVLRALSLAGHTEDGLRLLRSYWGGMIAEGATTFWEAYDPHWPKDDFHANLYADDNHGYFVSLSHGWSSGPTAWLTDCVLGVRPTSGGFQTAEIAPDLGDLQWAEGDVPTPRGPIHVRAEKTATGLSCRITLPAGVNAQVLLPGRAPVRLTHAGTYQLAGR